MGQRGLEKRGSVMNMNMISKYLLISTLLVICGCGSSVLVPTPTPTPTKNKCIIKKHWQDNVFQVLINDEPINKHFYIHDEALDLTKSLAKANKCMN